MKNKIQIGIFGLGTVGGGVLEQWRENADLIQKRIGQDIIISKAVTANPQKKRGFDLNGIQVSANPSDILEDPEIDIVVELIGGINPAREIIIQALDKGKSVVTANKALLAECSREIFKKAYLAKGFFGYEASVAGGIPVIRNLREGFSGDKIVEFSGIINGTANYILSAMTLDKSSFNTALQEAQQKGFAEADPTFDIEGTDSAHKLVILMNLAFNGLFDFNSIHVEGITAIEAIDIEIADEFEYSIKLLGKAVNGQKGIEGRVHPTLVSKDSVLSSVNGAFNAVYIVGNYVGPTLCYGQGAGSHPTASAVMSDIIEISRNLISTAGKSVSPLSCTLENLSDKKLLPMREIETEYYLRFSVIDEAGVLAEITKHLGENHISIRCMIQKTKEHIPGLAVTVVIFTHLAKEMDIQNALEKINKLDFVTEKTRLIRVDPV